MTRVALTVLLPLLAPTALYFLWYYAFGRKEETGSARPWTWLVLGADWPPPPSCCSPSASTPAATAPDHTCRPMSRTAPWCRGRSCRAPGQR